ncbi:hypothetical protein [Flavobacterium sp.]|uniref:hypothetical protein n=1 Tax=Flavobacterium sp. TaxID=239 RepID=UPI0012084CED|nr:hypothetical protein [Flavobacterium sp.]RZJ71782.1 MAG: hypothetical protein EOO49_08950 [Flavobacterium sp.]
MKKRIVFCVGVAVFGIFTVVVYNSKREFYEEKSNFYDLDFNGQITKITDGRATKIHYNTEDFFYTDFLENGVAAEETIKIGDVVKKQDSVLEVFRNDKTILSLTVEKPEESYFSFFFD